MAMNHNTTVKQNIFTIQKCATTLRVGALGLVCAFALTACGSSGGGSSNSTTTPPSGNAPQALNFSYPYDGQANVTPGALIRLKFNQGDAGDAGSLTLVSEDGDTIPVTPQVSDNNSLVSLETDGPLNPETEYTVRTNGNDLFSFTTAPNKTTPSPDGFKVTQATPDGSSIPFMAFSTLRIRFSEPVDPNTVAQGAGFSFTDSGGNQVPGNLYVQGRDLVFDPRLPYDPSRSTAECDRPDPQKPDSALACDLDPSKTYSFSLDSSVVKSVFGHPLQANGESSFSVTPRAVGGATVTSLAVATPQNGGDGNTVEVSSQLLGDNTLTVDPNSANLYTVVSQQLINAPALGGGVLPLVLRRGGSFQVSPLDVKFSGQIPAGISSGTLTNAFITDLSAYFTGSPFDNNGAVGIRLNFDVAVYGDDEKGNGAFNQNVLNVTAVGTASADGQGNLSIDSLGSFPVAVNGVDQATTNFRLKLRAPSGAPAGDSTPPTIVAQYPSACGYTLGQAVDVVDFYADRARNNDVVLDEDGHAIPASEPNPEPDNPNISASPVLQLDPDTDVPTDAAEDDCADYLTTMNNGTYRVRNLDGNVLVSQDGVAGINDVLPEENLSVTFSEPVDPASLMNTNGNADVDHIQLAGPSGNVPFNRRVEGSTVVIDPVPALDYNTEYTLTVGAGITDLAGNSLADRHETLFTTAPYNPSTDGKRSTVFYLNDDFGNLILTSPFLTTLYPGLPCALDPASGDFRTGGDTAGYCVGSDQSSSAPMRTWGVFDLPANRAIHMVFSKPVQSDTIALANGCLTTTDGSATVADNGGTVAVQVMDGSGNCAGVAEGDIVFPHPGDSYTRKANFHPAVPWQNGQRYWLVVCGTDSSVCTNSQTILDVDNGSPATGREVDAGFPTHDGRLNTDPMEGTGTNSMLNNTSGPEGYGLFPAAGGPDLIMPFDGVPASQDQFLVSDLAPFADINGNGFSDGAADLVLDRTGELSPDFVGYNLPPENRERPISANRVIARAMSISESVFGGRGRQITVFQSGAQPASVGAVIADCQVPGAIQDMIGSDPQRCAPVTVYPGGLVAQTGGQAGDLAAGAVYGRTLLHTAGVPDPDNPQQTMPQTGYIVDHCHGSYRINGFGSRLDDEYPSGDFTTVVGGQTQEYDYSPCFVLSQKLIFTADVYGRDDYLSSGIQEQEAPQQGLTVNLVGPVSFERNGRLVIRATNTNDIILDELTYVTAGGPNPVLVPAGATNLQLVGPAIHGGPLGAFKTQ